ncbi:MAG TPA: ABC transporter permease, partial [Vicinamibacteria bacterium]
FAGPPEGGGALGLILVDEDRSAGSRAFAQGLANAGVVSVIPMASAHEAAEAVRRGKQVAYVALPAGFGAASGRPFSAEGARVELGVDPSRKAEAAMLEGILMQQAATAMQRTLADRAATRKSIDESRSAVAFAPGGALNTATLRFLDELALFLESRSEAKTPDGGAGFSMLRVDRKPMEPERPGPRNAFDFTFPQGILWGVLGCASTFGTSLVAERSAGTLVRVQAAPVSRAQILGGKAIACLAAILGVESILVAVGMLAFHVRPLSYSLLGLAAGATAVAFVGIMMALSTLGQTERSASGAGWAVLLVMSMLGGGMVPLFVMPGWMATASHLSPVKWAILALEGALWRGFGLGEMLLPCAILVGVGTASFGLGARLFRSA